MELLSELVASVIASAFELEYQYVVGDALLVYLWPGSGAALEAILQERHEWTPESQLARNYVAALRRGLDR